MCDVCVHVCDVYVHVCDVYVHVCDVYVHVCDVCVHVCMCMCVMSVCMCVLCMCMCVMCMCMCMSCVCRHQDGGVKATRSLDDSNFGAISRGSGVVAADGLSSTHTGHTLEPAMPLPVGSKRCFCRSFVSGSIHRRPATFTVGLHPSTPPFHHTPWGLLIWQLDRTAITATAYRAVYLARPDGHFYGQGARQPLTPPI